MQQVLRYADRRHARVAAGGYAGHAATDVFVGILKTKLSVVAGIPVNADEGFMNLIT